MNAWLQQSALWCWQNSLAAAALALLVLGMRCAWRGKIAPRWLCVAGWLVMLRLFLPAPLANPWAWDRAWAAEKEVVPLSPPVLPALEIPVPPPRDLSRESAASRAEMESFPASPLPGPLPEMERMNDAAALVNLPAVVVEESPAAPPPVAASTSAKGVEEKPVALDWLLIGAWVWMAGALVFLSIVIFRHVRFMRRLVSQASNDCEQEILTAMEECARLAGLRRLPLLFTVPGSGSPFLCGLWRPRIVLPAETLAGLSREELRHVLLHEMLHISRRDLLANWLLAAVRAWHWWNPLIHLTARRLLADRELLRDQQAIALLSDPAERAAYAHTLLKLALPHSAPALSPGLAPFFRTEKELHRRLTMLQSPLRRPRLAACTAALTLTAFAAPVFSTARGQEEKKEKHDAVPATPVEPTQAEATSQTPSPGDSASPAATGPLQLEALRKQRDTLIPLKGEQLIAAVLELGIQDDDGVLQKLFPEYQQDVVQLRKTIEEGAQPNDPGLLTFEAGTRSKLRLLERIALKSVDELKARIAALEVAASAARPSDKEPDLDYLIGQRTVLKGLTGEKLLMAVYALAGNSVHFQKLYPAYQELQFALESSKGSGFGERHPKLIGLREAIKVRKEQLEREAQNYVEGLTVRIASATNAASTPPDAAQSRAESSAPELQQLRTDMAELKAHVTMLREAAGSYEQIIELQRLRLDLSRNEARGLGDKHPENQRLKQRIMEIEQRIKDHQARNQAVAPVPAPRAAAVKTTDQASENLPWGVAVPGRKDHVFTPYSPDSAVVDVSGFKKGDKVKCPHTGNFFRVP